MPSDLADVTNALAKHFIARPDAKAKQVFFRDGSLGYIVDTTDGQRDSPRLPWSRQAIEHHIMGAKTYGHYLLNTDDTCKVMAFDIDLNETGWFPGDDGQQRCEINPREAWLDRGHFARPWMKYQFKMLSGQIARAIRDELDIPVALAYSGGKGVHVYGFTGAIPASDVRLGSQIVIDSLGSLKLARGQVFWRTIDQEPDTGFPNITIEVFPKQDSLDGKDLGNLMRLPLGRNLKSNDPTFFYDLTGPMSALTPVDPIHALKGNPWRREGE